jgi:tape measure domain-containing protein
MAQLEFNIKANFDQIKQAKQELERLRGELLKTTKATDKAVVQDLTDKYAEQKQKVTELSSAMSRYALVMSSDYAKKMQSLTRETYAFELQADSSRRKIERLSSEIAKMQSKLRKGGLDIGTSTILNRDISENSNILNDEKRRYENLTGLGKQARIELQNMQAEYVRYSGSSSATTDNVKVMTDAFVGMIEEMKKVPTVGEGATSLFNRLGGDAKQLAMSLVGGLGFEQLAEHIFNVRSQFQQLEISFTTMLGSEQRAGALMNQLVQTAAKTPFDMSSITNGAKQLLAYGTAANEVNDILVHLGDISAGLNVPLNDLVYLYGTTMSQGRMYTMDLRQFMGRGIPMAEELGKIMGKTTQEVQQAVTDGKVGADLVKKAIINMTEEGGKFGGLMEKQSTTLQGKWSNIGDSVDQMFNELGKKSQGIFGTGLDLISSLIENWETLVKVIGSAAVMVGTYKAGLMAAASIQKVQNAMTMASITEELDSKLGEARDQENNFRSLNGKDTKQYRANRYKALGDAIADTSNIGDDKTEEIVSKQIEMARNEGLITEQMAQQLQTKRDLLVAQQKAADNERMEYENAKRTKEIEEEAARQKRADAEMAAEINAKAAKKAAIDEANNTPLGKAILNTNAIEEKKKQAEASIELAKEEAREQHGIVEEIGAQIKKQEELVAAKKEQVKSSYQNVTDLGGYDDSFGDDLKLRDQAVNQYVAEQQKLNDLKQKSYEASQKAYIADQKVLGMQEDLKGVTQELNQAIEEENRIYGETGASADEINKLVNEGVAVKEGDTAAVNANTAAKQGNTSTENANSTARNANTGATTRQSASNVANTTTENVNSVATGANTASQNVNTSAKQRNSFVTGMMSVGTKAATLAQSAFSWATNALTTSLRSLWAAMLANPLTTVITLVSTAISVFSMFGDETEDVATKATNLGNKASEASAKVRALFAILGDGKDAESHKDTIDALKNAYEEFGVKLDETIMKSENEASKVQELIKHKEDLIGVIEEQTVAMEHQNAIQQIYDTYKNDKDKAKTNFINDTDGVLTKEQAGMATMVVSQEDLDKMAKLQGEIDGLDKRTNKYKETVEKLRGVSGNVYKDIEAYYLNLKLTKEQIAEITAETYSYIAASTRANVNKQKSLDAEDKARAAVEKTRDAINKLSGSTMENAERNRLAKKSFKEMAVEMDEIRKICERTYHMKIKVDYDDKSLPAWIKNMSQSQRVESARARLSWLKTHKPGDTTKKFGGINKDYWTIYNENRGLQYKGEKVESTPTETEAQRKKRLAAEAKKKREAERAATKAEREANQKETMAGNKRKAEEDYSKSISSYSEKASDELSKRRTELIKNETEKEIAQINMSSDKEKKAIEDSIDKLVEAKKKKDQIVWVNSGKGRKANMWKQGKSDAEYRKEVLGTQMVDDKGNHLGKTIGQNSEDQIALIEKQRQLKLKEIQQAEIKDMLDFMKQYGSLEQQRYAILKEYTDKIDLAREKGDTFGAASAEMEMNDQLKKLNFSDFKDSINWDVVFQDMNRLSIPYLEDLRKKMKELLGSGTLEIDDMKTVSDQIYKIDDAISEQKDRWGLVNDAVREHRRLIDEAKDAQDRLAQARKGEFDAKADNMSQRRKIQGVFAESGVNIDTSNITSANKEKLMGSTKNLSVSQTEKLRKLFDDLAVSEVKVGKATKEVGKAQEEAKVKQDAAKKSLHDTIEERAEGLRKIQEKLKDLPGLVDALGLGNTGFGKAVNNGMDALNSGTQAFSDFASGNYIGAAMNGIKTIGSLGKMFGIGGGNGAEVAKKTEELTESNDRLMYSIDKLKESIDKSSGYTAVSNYNAAYDAQKQVNTQTMDILKTQMGYHGAHHSNAYYWNLSAQDYAAINKTLAEQSKIRGGYTNSSINKVNSLEDIYKLTPEQMADIRTHNADVWKNMTDQGKYDKTEYWEQYTELAGKLEELTEQINENLTQTTFDSMKSDFINNLMDMSKSAKDFSNDFTTMLNQSMLNFALGDLMNKKLKPLYESWANKMKENGGRKLTPTELNNLKEEYDKIVQEGLAIRDNIADITGYKQSYEQSASSGSFESMSQDTGDELNGRFTAVQIATEGTYEETKLINTKLDAIAARDGGTEGSLLTASVNTIMGNVGNIWLAVDEGRTILAQSLMYLQSIDERQERWHKPMLQAFNDIHELKDKMSRL